MYLPNTPPPGDSRMKDPKGIRKTLGVIAVALTVTWLVPAPAPAQDLQGTLKKIRDSGTITIGYREQSLPFSFRGDDGKPAGYSGDLFQRIGSVNANQVKLPKL